MWYLSYVVTMCHQESVVTGFFVETNSMSEVGTSLVAHRNIQTLRRYVYLIKPNEVV